MIDNKSAMQVLENEDALEVEKYLDGTVFITLKSYDYSLPDNLATICVANELHKENSNIYDNLESLRNYIDTLLVDMRSAEYHRIENVSD